MTEAVPGPRPYGLTPEQIKVLLKPIDKGVVKHVQGKGSSIPSYEVEAFLNYVFGFDGWSREVLESSLVYCESEERQRKNRDGSLIRDDDGNPVTYTVWTACYEATVRLTIKDPWGNVVCIKEDCATGVGEAQPKKFDALDKAKKEAISYAEKRCARSLGDGLGLSLYNKGQLDPVVKETLVRRDSTDGITAHGYVAPEMTVEREAPKALTADDQEGGDVDDETTDVAQPDSGDRAPEAGPAPLSGHIDEDDNTPRIGPDDDLFKAWLALGQSMPQVFDDTAIEDFKAWCKETPARTGKPRTERQFDEKVQWVQDRYRADHGGAHEWDPGELGGVYIAIDALRSDSTAERDWLEFQDFVFYEFAGMDPAGWTTGQRAKFLPFLRLGATPPATSTAGDDKKGDDVDDTGRAAA